MLNQEYQFIRLEIENRTKRELDLTESIWIPEIDFQLHEY